MHKKLCSDWTTLLNGNDLKEIDLSVQMFFSIQGFFFLLPSLLFVYYDYQWSKLWRSLGDKVLALKCWCCHGQLPSFPMVIILASSISCILLLNDIKGPQVAIRSGAVTHNNMIQMLKPGLQTPVTPCSNCNRSKVKTNTVLKGRVIQNIGPFTCFNQDLGLSTSTYITDWVPGVP